MKRLMFDKNLVVRSSSVIEEELFGRKLRFELYQNHRDKRLYINIASVNDESILIGKRVVRDRDILEGLVDERLPQGLKIKCICTNDNTLEEPNGENIMKEFYLICEV